MTLARVQSMECHIDENYDMLLVTVFNCIIIKLF